MTCRLQSLMLAHNLRVSETGKGEILTQVSLAEKAGIARSTLRRLYTDAATRIDYATVDSLCEFFDCEIGDLFVRKEPAND